MFWPTVVTCLLIWLVFATSRERRRHRDFHSRVEALAQRMFMGETDAPSVKVGWSYGWPTVSLLFTTAEARSRLSERGTIQQFRAQLEAIVRGIWPRRRRFNVDKALYVTSIPERDALRDAAVRKARAFLEERERARTTPNKPPRGP
jgi:hypothetical protein